jgi:hypothetical protein
MGEKREETRQILAEWCDTASAGGSCAMVLAFPYKSRTPPFRTHELTRLVRRVTNRWAE